MARGAVDHRATATAHTVERGKWHGERVPAAKPTTSHGIVLATRLDGQTRAD